MKIPVSCETNSWGCCGADVSKTDGRVCLGRAKDKTKDQSYFLNGVVSEKLARFALPLGELTKEDVRSIASELNLSIADKAESMELCFAGGPVYGKIRMYGDPRPCEIIDVGKLL
jgi:tRNA U34 2-thiouridine synthase MnmA/TrmU